MTIGVLPTSTRTTLMLAVTITVLAALLVRVWGLKFGLPELYYWDEPTVVNRAMRFGTGDLNPHFWYYPSLYLYVLFATSSLYFVLAKMTHQFSSAPEFAQNYFTDPTGVYLTARFTTALLGTVAVLAAYWLGKRYFDRRTGLIAAVLLALSPLHVSHSHIAITDVPHALLICLASIVCLNVLEHGRTRDYALGGTLIGLGAATKYTAILNGATLLLAHLLRTGNLRRPIFAHIVLSSPQLWLGFGLIIAGFFIGSPYSLLSFSEFITDFRTQMALSSGDAHQGWLLLRTLFTDFGIPISLIGAFGLYRMLSRPTRATWVFLCFPAIYSLLMLGISKSFSRYLLPESAFVAVIAAYGFTVISEWLRLQLSTSLYRVGVATAFCVTIAQPLCLTVAWDRLEASGMDTRTAARSWAEHFIPSGAPIAIQSLYDRTFDNVPVVTDRTIARLERVLPTSGGFGRVREAVLDAWRSRHQFRDVGWSDNPAWLAKSGAQYLFLSAEDGEPSSELSDWLSRSGRMVKQFDPVVPWPLSAMENDGRETLPVIPPRLRIYYLKP